MGKSEFLVKKNDIEDLKDKMTTIYQDTDLRESIGNHHLGLVKKYSLENYCLRLKELFEKYS